LLIKEIYDKVNQKKGISQTEFLTAFNEALLRLNAKYGTDKVFVKGQYAEPRDVFDSLPIYQEWVPCLIDYAMYINTGDESSLRRFEDESDYAYRTVWSTQYKGHRHYLPDWN